MSLDGLLLVADELDTLVETRDPNPEDMVKAFRTACRSDDMLPDQRCSAKIEYQFVDLGTETVRITALTPFLGTAPAVHAAFRNQFHVSVGLNYRY
jgi:hypothetical protein